MLGPATPPEPDETGGGLVAEPVSLAAFDEVVDFALIPPGVGVAVTESVLLDDWLE